MTTTGRRRLRLSTLLPRTLGEFFAVCASLGSYLVLACAALVVACTDAKSPTGPNGLGLKPTGARFAIG